MAKVDLVGVQELDFVDKKTGNPVQGISLQINFLDPNVMGKRADHKFLSRELCEQLKYTVDFFKPLIFTEIELETNLKGQVTGVKPVAKSN